MQDFQTYAEQIATQYLQALRDAELSAVLALFTPTAQVISPLYGLRVATNFYAELFADTSRSEVSLQDVLVHEARRSMALLFTYRWTLADGQEEQFEVVDYCLLDEAGKIAELRILYDTAAVRPLWARRD